MTEVSRGLVAALVFVVGMGIGGVLGYVMSDDAYSRARKDAQDWRAIAHLAKDVAQDAADKLKALEVQCLK